MVRPWLGMQGAASTIAWVRSAHAVTPGYLVEVVYDGRPRTARDRGGNLSVAVQGEESCSAGHPHPDHGTDPRIKTTWRASRPARGAARKITVVRDGTPRELSLSVAERPRLPSDLSD